MIIVLEIQNLNFIQMEIKNDRKRIKPEIPVPIQMFAYSLWVFKSCSRAILASTI